MGGGGGGGGGDALGVWDGNPIKLDCDDHCTSINVINSLSNKKRYTKVKILCLYVCVYLYVPISVHVCVYEYAWMCLCV